MGVQRFHDMDFCRAVFMYCGILFHCGLIYGSGQDWRVLSEQTSGVISLLSNFLHHFRMEAFYLVSGFFFLLIFNKQRPGFVKDRIARAMIPMLVIGLSLNFAMNALSINNQSYQVDWRYFVEGKWLAHLWFLGNLIVYFAIAAPLVKLWQSKSELSSSPSSLLHSAKGLFGCFCGLTLIALAGHYLASAFGFKTVIFINFGYLFYYGPFFLMGLIAFANRDAFYRLIKLSTLPFYLACYTLLQALCLLNPEWSEGVKHLLKQISHFPLMLAAFSFLCFIGQRSSKAIRFFSEASYTIYLFHQPLLIIFYYYLFQHIQLGAVTEYLLLVTLVFAVSSFIHLVIVNRFDSAKLLLNGVLMTKATPPSSSSSTRLAQGQ